MNDLSFSRHSSLLKRKICLTKSISSDFCTVSSLKENIRLVNQNKSVPCNG